MPETTPTPRPDDTPSEAKGVGSSYPELREIASRIADETCFSINRGTEGVESKMPYKEQFVLEETIKILQGRV